MSENLDDSGDLKPQKRGGRMAMTPQERDAHLSEAWTCRVGTTGAEGAAHVSALWFVWDGEALWLNSIVKSQRWTNLIRDPRISVLVDDGHDFLELRGIEIIGRAEVIGEVPRMGEPNDELAHPEKAFADKYADGTFRYDGRHAWMKVVPEKIVTWDYRKLAG